MKRILLAVLVLFTAPSLAVAASGKAVLSHYQGFFATPQNFVRPLIHVTNISDQNIKVRITIYDQFGAVFRDGDDDPATGGIKGRNVDTNYDEDPGNESVEFTLLPRNTGRVELQLPDLIGDENRGYAVIEWKKNNSDLVVAMVAHASITRSSSSTGTFREYSVMINNGMPF